VASGATRFTLSPDDKAALVGRRITASATCRATRVSRRIFFRERLGEPAAWREIDEHSVQWLYPELGLTLLLSSEDGAVFEYAAPRDFVLPAGVALAEP